MKKLLTSFAAIAIAATSFSQQDAQFSHNMFNKLAINPGYAGTSQAMCATMLYRQQWTGFPGAPKTMLFSGDATINAIRGGIGLTVVSDKLGFDNTFIGKLAYSFNLPVGPGTLGLGIEGGMMKKSLFGPWIAPEGVSGDLAIPVTDPNNTTWDLGFGAYYATNQLYFGLSSLHLPQTAFPSVGTATAYSFDMVRHYYLMAGYEFPVSQSIDIKPSILAKSDAASTQLDVNVLGVWNRMIWAGASYRLTDAIVALVGYQGGNAKMTWKIGYSYDITMSTLKEYSSGTHEILLNYCFKIEPKAKVQSHQNVRFL